MSSGSVISVRNISKSYRIWETPAARLLAPLLEGFTRFLPKQSFISQWARKRVTSYYRDFAALQDISFKLGRGEAMGIIGRNGAGKSTLLQIIAGTLQPTSGTAQVQGRVAALLELGAGFNPEFTGRENVFLNGAVLGLSQAQIAQKFGAIAAFAEIGDFMDQPVKTYSSGMGMRLAFAVQTAVEPDVLIVDEAMAVGDAPFQAKCFKRMRELLENGVALLFVSHDVGTVRAICPRALCLSGGRTHSQGTAKEVCDDYQLLCMREQGIVGDMAKAPAESITEAAANFHIKNGPRNQEFARHANQQRAGSGVIKFIDCYIADQQGRPTNNVEFNQEVLVCWLMEAREAVSAEVVIGVNIKNVKGIEVLSATDKERDHMLNLQAGQTVLVTMPFGFPLSAGRYYLTSSLFRFPPGSKFLYDTINFDESELFDLVEYSCYFEVNWNRRWAHYGPVQRDSPMTFKPLSPSS